MNQNKLVSVTINAYNSEKYIAETLTSVINQSYKNLQIIVVDDASSDATADIVKGFDDPRIELYTLEKNGHISNANNECYRKVRGEYMVHIDSDDIMLPDLIKKSVSFLEEHQEYGAVFCRPTIIDQNSNSVRDEFLETIFKCEAKTQAEFVRLFFDSSNHLLHPGATIRKSVLDDIGFHDLSLCYLHDFDYWTRLVLKYQVYVLDEFLIKYRMDTSGSHNSDLSDAKTIAHNTEYARIIYNMIENCPDELFLEAFSDRLRIEDEHTHEEIELEKAFLLQDALIVLPQNKILSIVKFAQLFQDKKYVELARDKFGFTIRDFYKLQTQEILHNQINIDTKQHEFNLHVRDFYSIIDGLNLNIANLNENLTQANENLAQTNEKLNEAHKNIAELNGVICQKDAYISEVVSLANDRQSEIERLNSIINYKQKLLNRTVEYRMAKLFKKLLAMLKHSYHFICLRDKNGKKYRKSVMLYGFYGMNLGDDLFFEKLIKRYPDTLFLVYCFSYYRPFFEQFDNVKFYAYEDAFVQKVNDIGKKIKVHDLFELLLLKRSNATVHIGGSIYQQIGDYELDYKLRVRRKQPFKPFYSISCNFGAFKTEEFKHKWRKQFKKFKDICFRDRYSYELFSDLKGVRQAPDLLFSYKAEQNEEISNSVAISVFNPFASHRSIPEHISNAYLEAIAKTVTDLVADGKKVTLLGFCAFEGDGVLLHDLLCRLPDGMREKINAINYSFETKDQILNALSTAEYVIGTRLHSVILGLVNGKKVLPIAYDQKINYILKDINYNQAVIGFDEIAKYKETGLANLLNDLTSFDVSEYSNSDDLQFARLDCLLK